MRFQVFTYRQRKFIVKPGSSMPKRYHAIENLFLLSMLFIFALLGLYNYQVYGQTTERHTSDLWGTKGELWSPTSRLPDYSFAGYHAGEKAIPNTAVVANVRDFGAVPNDSGDDSQAFNKAIASISNGAILVPAGKYVINRPVVINKPNIVLLGENRDETILLAGHVPGNCARSNQGSPNCAPYGGIAMLEIRGKVNGSKLSDVSADAKRGDHTLQLLSAASLKAGQIVRLRMKNPRDNSLGCYLYADAGCLNAERQQWYGGNIVDWKVKIESISGDSVTLERPLRTDIRTAWAPEIWSYSPTVQESGIENLTIQFPGAQYAGHNKEEGFYGIFILHAFNSWVRDVTIVDADRGVEISGVSNTISGVIFKTRHRTPILTDDVYVTGHY